VAGPRLDSELVAAVSEGVLAVGWEINILSEDMIDLRMLVHCRDEGDVQRIAQSLAPITKDLVRMGLAERPASTPIITRARWIELHVRFTKLQQMLHLGGTAGSGSPTPSPSGSAAPTGPSPAASVSPSA
jgi:hypothetical protein